MDCAILRQLSPSGSFPFRFPSFSSQFPYCIMSVSKEVEDFSSTSLAENKKALLEQFFKASGRFC